MGGPMVSYGEREIPHEQLRTEAARTAAGLVEAGVRHGDRVAIVLRNEPAFLSLSAAAIRANASLISAMGASVSCMLWTSNSVARSTAL